MKLTKVKITNGNTPTLELCPAGDIVIPEGQVLAHSPAMKARRLTWHCVQSSPEWCVK